MCRWICTIRELGCWREICGSSCCCYERRMFSVANVFGGVEPVAVPTSRSLAINWWVCIKTFRGIMIRDGYGKVFRCTFRPHFALSDCLLHCCFVATHLYLLDRYLTLAKASLKKFPFKSSHIGEFILTQGHLWNTNSPTFRIIFRSEYYRIKCCLF